MTDKSDHLIERAAALLRSASAARPAEQAGEALRVAAPPSAPRPDSGPSLPPGVPPLLVPPPRAGVMGPAPTAIRPRPFASGTAADLRATSAIEPIALDTLERAGLMVARNKRTRTAEEYRIVIGRVLRALHEDPGAERARGDVAPNVVMVTSARPGEGKS